MYAHRHMHTPLELTYIFMAYFYKFMLSKLNEICWQIFVLPNKPMTNLHTNISHLHQNFKVTFMQTTLKILSIKFSCR